MLIASYIGCKLTPVELLCDIYSRTSECCTGLSLVPRAVATVGPVVITIYSAMRWLHHPFSCFLGGRWFQIWHRNLRIRKTDRTGHLKFLTLQWGPQKLANFNKKGLCRLQMTRGFQIWSQNLNRTTFDPLLAQKRSKTGFCQYSTFFGQIGCQILFDLNL